MTDTTELMGHVLSHNWAKLSEGARQSFRAGRRDDVICVMDLRLSWVQRMLVDLHATTRKEIDDLLTKFHAHDCLSRGHDRRGNAHKAEPNCQCGGALRCGNAKPGPRLCAF